MKSNHQFLRGNRISQLIFSMGPAILLFFILDSCKSSKETLQPEPEISSLDFRQVEMNFSTGDLILPSRFQYKILFSPGDLVKAADGREGPAKPKNDFLAFLPINGNMNHGLLWVNHECGIYSEILGSGGGGTFLEVKRTPAGWEVINRTNADFSEVGGTLFNCLGTVTPWGTILTSEEVEPNNDLVLPLLCGTPDTRPLNQFPRHLNYGWVVEVDPVSKKAIRKLWSMGRFMHEGIFCAPDSQTVYLMDDEAPSVFFKFEAFKKGSYETGQLFAYRQTEGDKAGEWFPLPMMRDSLNYARNVALRMGATIFFRMEDIIQKNDGKFLITETGRDTINLRNALEMGGVLANHLKKTKENDTIFHDYYGRILEFDPVSGKISVFLEGGADPVNPARHFSNPDNIAYDSERNLLAICEDINNITFGRIPASATGQKHNEIWMLDLGAKSINLANLKRFAVTPPGSEPTGLIFSPDSKTLFLNIQGPDSTNARPFNVDATVAIELAK